MVWRSWKTWKMKNEQNHSTMRTTLKLLTLTGCCWLLAVSCMTPNYYADTVDDIYQRYKGKPGMFSMELPGSLVSWIFKEDGQENKQLRKSIEVFQLLVSQPEAAEAKRTMEKSRKELKKLLTHRTYQELMTVNSDGEKLVFKFREKGGKVTELIMFAEGDEGFVMLSLQGKMDKKLLKKACKDININSVKSRGN